VYKATQKLNESKKTKYYIHVEKIILQCRVSKEETSNNIKILFKVTLKYRNFDSSQYF